LTEDFDGKRQALNAPEWLFKKSAYSAIDYQAGQAGHEALA
jgi:hypothetical protein